MKTLIRLNNTYFNSLPFPYFKIISPAKINYFLDSSTNEGTLRSVNTYILTNTNTYQVFKVKDHCWVKHLK